MEDNDFEKNYFYNYKKQVKLEELDIQFLDSLNKECEDKTLDDIKQADSKQIIKTFMRTPALYRETKMVLQATVIGAIKISIESLHHIKIPHTGDIESLYRCGQQL